nr:MAG TPA: hypothetical protein [Caudoviricetes sp.]
MRKRGCEPQKSSVYFSPGKMRLPKARQPKGSRAFSFVSRECVGKRGNALFAPPATGRAGLFYSGGARCSRSR